ncbi:MAG: hypothetical protein AB7F32_02135 [Victivallaceae bacterium]
MPKLAIASGVLIAIAFVMGSSVTKSPDRNNDEYPLDFKISQNGVISFYANYPAGESILIADCMLDETLTWALTVREFNSEKGNNAELFYRALSDFIPKVERFLARHCYRSAPITFIRFTSANIGLDVPKAFSASKELETIDHWGQERIDVSLLRKNLWANGIKMFYPFIEYRSEENDFRISITRIDIQDTLYQKDGIVPW